MQVVLQTLVAELQRLKAQGVESLPVSEEALRALRNCAGVAEEPAPKPKPPQRSATTEAKTPHAIRPPTATPRPKVAEPSIATPSVSKVATEPTPEPQPPPAPKFPPPTIVLPEGDKNTRMQWLRERVLNDPICLSSVRPGKKVVLGVGTLDAKIMFIGEAPGAEEEIQGEPFVGPAGMLLTKMIAACGLKREEVYIGNIMNWRPQLPTGMDGIQRGNREPNEEEMGYCLPFLRAQIEIVNPSIIVALGATAAKGLLGFRAFRTLGEVRGRWHEYLGRPLMVTYHPSYLLHREADGKESARKAKRIAWEDFLLLLEKAGLPITEKQKGFFLNK